VYFASGFESGTLLTSDSPPGDWDSMVVSPGCSLSVERDAALHGEYGLKSLCNGVESGSAYAEKSFQALTSCYARFELGLGGWAPWGVDTIAELKGPTGSIVTITGTTFEEYLSIVVSTFTDTGSSVSILLPPLAPGTVVLQVYWKASSAPGMNNGELRVWVFDALIGQKPSLNNDLLRVDGVRVGYHSSAEAEGPMLFDGVAVSDEFVPAERHCLPLRLR